MLRSKDYVPRVVRQKRAKQNGNPMLTYSIRMTVNEWLTLDKRAKMEGISKAEFVRSKLR